MCFLCFYVSLFPFSLHSVFNLFFCVCDNLPSLFPFIFSLFHPFFCCTFVAPTLVFPLAFTFFISSYSFSISCLSDPHYLSSSSLFSPSSSSLSISPLLLRYVSLIPSFHSSYISSPFFFSSFLFSCLFPSPSPHCHQG